MCVNQVGPEIHLGVESTGRFDSSILGEGVGTNAAHAWPMDVASEVPQRTLRLLTAKRPPIPDLQQFRQVLVGAGGIFAA